MGCGDLRDFQKVVKVSSKYECALYSPVITMEKIRDEKGRSKNVKRFSGGEVQLIKHSVCSLQLTGARRIVQSVR